MNRYMRVATILIAVVMLASCAYNPLGDFTVASTNNVRNLHYDIPDVRDANVTGTKSSIFFLGIKLTSDQNMIEKAMDEAIEKGRKDGIDGDLLVNVRIETKSWAFLGIFFTKYRVKGDLVKLKTPEENP